MPFVKVDVITQVEWSRCGLWGILWGAEVPWSMHPGREMGLGLDPAADFKFVVVDLLVAVPIIFGLLEVVKGVPFFLELFKNSLFGIRADSHDLTDFPFGWLVVEESPKETPLSVFNHGIVEVHY